MLFLFQKKLMCNKETHLIILDKVIGNHSISYCGSQTLHEPEYNLQYLCHRLFLVLKQEFHECKNTGIPTKSDNTVEKISLI